MYQSGGLQHLCKRNNGVFVKIEYAPCPVVYVNNTIPAWIHCGDTAGAPARRTVTGLNTTNSKHEWSRHVAPIGTKGAVTDNIIGTNDFRRGGNFHAVAQPGTTQAIINENQRIPQRRPQMLSKFHWSRSRSTFRSVYCNEVNPRTGFNHSFHDRYKFPWMANT